MVGQGSRVDSAGSARSIAGDDQLHIERIVTRTSSISEEASQHVSPESSPQRRRTVSFTDTVEHTPETRTPVNEAASTGAAPALEYEATGAAEADAAAPAVAADDEGPPARPPTRADGGEENRPLSPARGPRVTDKLRGKLTQLQLELQRIQEEELKQKAGVHRASEAPPASVVTLVLDLDTIAHDERLLLPEGPAEFFIGKLLAAGLPLAFQMSGMDLELLYHLNPRLLKQLISHPLAVLVSSTWARTRPSLYPEVFHLNILADKITRTEVGVIKSRLLFLTQSDIAQSLIAFLAAADYPVVLLDHLETHLSPLHPYQTPAGVPDTCIVRALGVHSAAVRAVMMNAQGSCQAEFEAAVRGDPDAITALEKRLLAIARTAEPADPGNAEKKGPKTVYGAVKIDFLKALSEGKVLDAPGFDEVSTVIADSLLALNNDALTFKSLDEDTIKGVSIASDLAIYLPTPPPIQADELLSRVKALSHRTLFIPEYHQRLLLSASSSSLTPVNRDMCLACLDLIPDVIPDDGAESLDIILVKHKDDPARRQCQVLHAVLSQYTTNAPSVLQILH